MLVASGGIEAAVSLESMVFAMWGLGTQDTHCWGQHQPALGAKAGNLNLIFLIMNVYSARIQHLVVEDVWESYLDLQTVLVNWSRLFDGH